MIRFARAVMGCAVMLGGCDAPARQREDAPAVAADTARFPAIMENTCQGEMCLAAYTAVPCRDVVLVAGPRNRAVVGALSRRDTVEVQTDLHLEKPGVVVMKRDVTVADDWNSGINRPPPLRFAQGDTLFLLRYIGEGFWWGSYRGRTTEVAEFWGGPGPIDSPEDSARALNAMGTWPVMTTWLRISRGGRVVGWWQDSSGARTMLPIGESARDRGFSCTEEG